MARDRTIKVFNTKHTCLLFTREFGLFWFYRNIQSLILKFSWLWRFVTGVSSCWSSPAWCWWRTRAWPAWAWSDAAGCSPQSQPPCPECPDHWGEPRWGGGGHPASSAGSDQNTLNASWKYWINLPLHCSIELISARQQSDSFPRGHQYPYFPFYQDTLYTECWRLVSVTIEFWWLLFGSYGICVNAIFTESLNFPDNLIDWKDGKLNIYLLTILKHARVTPCKKERGFILFDLDRAFTYLTWDSITGVTWDVGGIIQTSLATSNRCWEILSISWPLCQDLFSWQTSVNHLVNIAWEKIELQDCNMVKITFLFP